MILSYAVDEVQEDFEPVERKPQLDSDTEADGTCLTSNLPATVWQCSPAPQYNGCFTLQLKKLMSLSLSWQENLILTETQPWASVYLQVEGALHSLK